MWTSAKRIFLMWAILCGITNQLEAQTSYEANGFRLKSDINSFESEVHQSILALKKAEANLKDTLVANQLEEIGYLAIVQSGFSTNRSDRFNRKGYWMLAYPVAIKYGLIINRTIDERMVLAKSTQAAYRYWNDLVHFYNNEKLADLTFIQSTILVAKHQHDSLNYAINHKYEETRVKLESIKKIYQQNTIKTIGPDPSIVEVSSASPISFTAIHHFIQIPTAELKRLNPGWTLLMYNPTFGGLNLPLTYKAEFEKHVIAMEQKTRDENVLLAAENKKRLNQLKGDIPDLNTHKPIRYKVKAGDNLGKIAQRYHVKIASIRSWNELRSDRIYAGQRLTIYIRNNQKVEVEKPIKKPVAKKKKQQSSKGSFSEYTVKAGDTLWGISQLFEGVTADIIMEDNGIDTNIDPGQVLKIRKIE